MMIEAIVHDPFARRQDRLRYEVPPDMTLEVGDMVVLPLRNKEKVAFVLEVLEENTQGFQLKKVLYKLDAPGLEKWQIKLATWLAEQNRCPLYDVIKSMVPKHIWRIPPKRKTKPKEVQAKTPCPSPTELDPMEHMGPRILWNQSSKITRFTRYATLIQHSLSQGKSALLLIPDRYLDPELLTLFEKQGLPYELWTSFTSEGEKARLWNAAQKGELSFLIGTRSSLFVPLQNLDWIIMDEENELAYKQESLPRYHTRSLVMLLHHERQTRLLLGGECPSIESQVWAEQDRLHWYEEGQTQALRTKLIDMREELRAKNYSIFSEAVQQSLENNLRHKKQSLLILNKSGYSKSVLCRDCGYSPSCPHCECSLSYHKWMEGRAHDIYFCHTCNYEEKAQVTCPSCQGTHLKLMGAGTEKVEEEVLKKYPKTPLLRIDQESFKNQKDYKALCQKIHETPELIIISTSQLQRAIPMNQLGSITLLLADQGLHFPDFRAEERWLQRSFQIRSKLLHSQEQGQLLIQSYNTENPIFEHFFNSSYLGWSKEEIQRRKQFNFPPFTGIAKLTIKNMDKKIAREKAERLRGLAQEIAQNLEGESHIYASPALQAKRKGFYYWNICIFREDPQEILSQIHPEILREWTLDLDPLTVL